MGPADRIFEGKSKEIRKHPERSRDRRKSDANLSAAPIGAGSASEEEYFKCQTQNSWTPAKPLGWANR
jgi:hypothetical protein